MSESRVNDLMGKNAVEFEERVDMSRLKRNGWRAYAAKWQPRIWVGCCCSIPSIFVMPPVIDSPGWLPSGFFSSTPWCR